MHKIKSPAQCHEGSQGSELYDWKQVARSLRPR